MANLIKLRKGLDINLKGKAAAEVVAGSRDSILCVPMILQA